MAYTVRITPVARRQIKDLERTVQERIIKCLEKLGTNPRPQGVKKLSGAESLYRVRVGDYRIIYEIQDKALVVLVVKVAHRREAY